MRKIEYEMLKYLQEPHTIEQVLSHLKRFKKFDIEDTFEILLDKGYISEHYSKELQLYGSVNINSLSGNMGKPTGHYSNTQEGVEAFEYEHRQIRKQSMSTTVAIVSMLCVLLTLVIEAIRLLMELL